MRSAIRTLLAALAAILAALAAILAALAAIAVLPSERTDALEVFGNAPPANTGPNVITISGIGVYGHSIAQGFRTGSTVHELQGVRMVMNFQDTDSTWYFSPGLYDSVDQSGIQVPGSSRRTDSTKGFPLALLQHRAQRTERFGNLPVQDVPSIMGSLFRDITQYRLMGRKWPFSAFSIRNYGKHQQTHKNATMVTPEALKAIVATMSRSGIPESRAE
jgi:hypothetical protein